MRIITRGVTRTVIIIGNYVFKFPCLHYKWDNFLTGLLCNIQEIKFKNLSDKLCPILFYLPGGFLNVMPKCKMISEDEFYTLDLKDYINLPIEFKQDSFGKLNNKIVAIDYGS